MWDALYKRPFAFPPFSVSCGLSCSPFPPLFPASEGAHPVRSGSVVSRRVFAMLPLFPTEVAFAYDPLCNNVAESNQS